MFVDKCTRHKRMQGNNRFRVWHMKKKKIMYSIFSPAILLKTLLKNCEVLIIYNLSFSIHCD